MSAANAFTFQPMADKRMTLWVLKVNPAKRLYERLGFIVTETTNEHCYMEYRRKGDGV